MDLFTLPRVWQTLLDKSQYYTRRAAIHAFNNGNIWRKRGIAITPCRQDPQP